MNKSRTWYVEDIHDQTSLYIKAYKNKPKDVATVKVVEELPTNADNAVFYSSSKDEIYSGSIVMEMDGDRNWLIKTLLSDSKGNLVEYAREELDTVFYIGDI
jgi:hypothetical protein